MAARVVDHRESRSMSTLPGLPLDQLQALLIESVPQNRALGLRVMHCAAGRMRFDLPYRSDLTGAGDDGLALHEAAITTLIDTTAGSAILSLQNEFRRPATLDLRVDYLRWAQPGRTLRCEAICESLGDDVAVVRVAVDDGDPADRVAIATGSFARFSAPARSAS